MSENPKVGDFYIAEHSLFRDRFSVVRIDAVTAQTAKMAEYRPRTKWGLVGEGSFSLGARRRLNNLRCRLPSDCDVEAVAQKLNQLHEAMESGTRQIRAQYNKEIEALGE